MTIMQFMAQLAERRVSPEVARAKVEAYLAKEAEIERLARQGQDPADLIIR